MWVKYEQVSRRGPWDRGRLVSKEMGSGDQLSVTLSMLAVLVSVCIELATCDIIPPAAIF